jgi:hypothetical protein
VVAVMTYSLAALSVGLVSIPLLIVVWLVVKAPIRIRTLDLVFLGLLRPIFFDQWCRPFRRPLGDKPYLHSGRRWAVNVQDEDETRQCNTNSYWRHYY